MKNKKLALMLGCVMLFVVAGYWLTSPRLRSVFSDSVSINENKLYKVAHVLDGDTFIVNVDGKDITVRMLGINTPETVDPRKPIECFGVEASNETKSLLDGRLVQFKINPNRELLDKYKRYLLYVYRDDGLFINESLIKNGFAREYTYGKPYSLRSEFKKAEKEAKKAKKGLWSKCTMSDIVQITRLLRVKV